jgi:formamidopyrimidine-DNA glycosylase
MPELPEVEVTRRRIAPLLVGRRIRSVRTTGRSALFLTEPARLRRDLAGRRVEAVGRRGKYLVARLDEGSRLVVHLGMTGQLFASGTSSERLLSATARAALTPEAQRCFRPDAHTHLRLGFEDAGPEVLLRDVRKFGKVLLLPRGESHPRLDRLGVDALRVSGEALFRASRGRSVAVKALLLDQAVVTGVGNIYADEALFRAGVRPTRRAGRVTRREWEALAQAIRSVMQRSIATGGSSIRDYLAPDGSDGAYQDERRVYARAGEPCFRCGRPVRRIVVGQRGTHYCPGCQR